MDKVIETKQLAEANALKFSDFGNGHLQIEGHGIQINYWPNSKNRTAHIKNGEVIKHCSPWDAVRLCLISGKPGLRPKKKRITKNKPQVNLDSLVTNPACIRHFYDGKSPPWEYEMMIVCESDNIRIQAYKLLCEAECMDFL